MSGSRHEPTLGERRATEDLIEEGFSPEEAKQLAGALIEALRPMAEAEEPPRLMLEVIQWRELGDDEDSLSSRIAETNAQPFGPILAEEYGLHYGEESDAEGKGLFLSTNEMTVVDGEVFTDAYSGRKFRINISEVSE